MNQSFSKGMDVSTRRIIRVGYFLYLGLVAYLLWKGDVAWAVANFGIAIGFIDPSDTDAKWRDKPFYVKVWLMAHLALLFIGFVYMLVR